MTQEVRQQSTPTGPQAEPELTGVRNFRDVGGLPTADGRRVRPGVLFRSGHLAHASAQDAAYLEGLGELPEVFQAELADEADALGERLRTEVRAMGRPASSAMFEHVYATPHAVVDADREWFAGYEASFEGDAR